MGLCDRPLREVVGPAFSISDIATITGVSKSTVSRLWDDVDWIGAAHRQTVHRLEMVLPAVHCYCKRHAQASRLAEAAENARRADLEVDPDAVQRLGLRLPPITLALVLDAATAFAQNDARGGFRRLDLCWGAQVDPCVSLLFDERLIANQQILRMRLAAGLSRRIPARTTSPVAIGHGIVTHKLIKCGYDVTRKERNTGISMSTAFQTRSRAVADIFATGDHAFADKLHKFTRSEPINAVNELWSLATYSGDISTGCNPTSIPARIGLRRTVSEILADLNSQNNAYVLYLAHTVIPIVSEWDKTFAGRKNSLVKALIGAQNRAEEDGSVRALPQMCRDAARLVAGVNGRL